MAVAARAGAPDARVPCPLCGGLIHPIAGKCKHCKADLTAYRSARPAANAALPALHRAPAGDGHVPDPPAGVAAPSGADAAPVPAAIGHAGSHPVLPPRPLEAAPAAVPALSTWRSWPVLVIMLATAAIIAAAVLMVWPAHRAEPSGKRAGKPPPAPERMDTQPQPVVPRLAPPSAAPAQPAPQRAPAPDPWNAPQAAPAPDPGAPPSAPSNAPDDDSGALLDDAPSQGVPGGSAQILPDARSAVMFAMAEHLCRKMVQCGNSDAMMKSMCDTIAHSGVAPPSHCPAAERCLQHIDTMSCGTQDTDLTRLTALFTQFTDCADAIRC